MNVDEHDRIGRTSSEAKMEPVTCSVADAAKAIGIGRVTLYKLINQKKVEAVKVGGRTLVTTESIRTLIANADRLAA